MIAPEERAARAFEERAARAEQIAATSPAAREPLLFAAGLYREQARMARGVRDLESAIAEARPLFEYAARTGPSLLAADARALLASGGLPGRLQAYWSTGAFDYLARAALAPLLRVLRERGEPSKPFDRPGGPCGFCGGAPWVASLRGGGTSLEGAQRRAHCALCGGEWQVLRIACIACGEQDPDQLPGFSAEEHPGARLETCATCHTYVKSIDLSLDARRIPEVDDLASLSLDLWAAEQGYDRVEPGLAGL